MGKVMFSLCPHLGGGGQVQPGESGPAGGVSHQGGSATGGRVRSSWGGGQVRGGQPPGGVSQDRTTKGVLAIWRAVCRLRSRRRTFLFILINASVRELILANNSPPNMWKIPSMWCSKKILYRRN